MWVNAGATRSTFDSTAPSASSITSVVVPMADGALNAARLHLGRSIGAGSQHSFVIVPWLGRTSRTWPTCTPKPPKIAWTRTSGGEPFAPRTWTQRSIRRALAGSPRGWTVTWTWRRFPTVHACERTRGTLRRTQPGFSVRPAVKPRSRRPASWSPTRTTPAWSRWTLTVSPRSASRRVRSMAWGSRTITFGLGGGGACMGQPSRLGEARERDVVPGAPVRSLTNVRETSRPRWRIAYQPMVNKESAMESSTSTSTAAAPRDKRFLLARAESRALTWIAHHLPARAMPDHLTVLGVLAALGIAAAYVLSNGDRAWLWAASGLLVVHWLGDSLDGTLARVRGIKRPTYGYYLDHLVDAIATALIGLGLGLSSYLLLATGLVIVVAYLVLSINTYLETQALGVFTLGYGRLGPTEARLGPVALNTAPPPGAPRGHVPDPLVLAAAGLMAAGLLVRAVRNLRLLAEREPARHQPA